MADGRHIVRGGEDASFRSVTACILVQMYLSVRISSMKSLRKLFNFLRSMIL
jgi:hypothetical protein